MCASAIVENQNIAYKAPSIAYTASTTTVPQKIVKSALQHGIDPNRYFELIRCETAGTFDPDIQSDVRYNFSDPSRGIRKGERERSYGLLQIHQPDNPHITIEQMTNPDWALDWGAKEVKKGNHSWRWVNCSKKAGMI